MSAQLLSSKIVVQEEPPSLRTIPNVASGVLAAIGVTAKGPVGVSTLITSFENFVNVFGGDIAAGIATSAIRGYFSGGGQRLYFTRVVHYSDITNANTKTSAPGLLVLKTSASAPSAGSSIGLAIGPFALTPGDTLVIGRDGQSPATVTFEAEPAQVVSEGTGTYALANGQTLTVKIDGGAVQTVTFQAGSFISIGAATAAEVAAVLNAALAGASAAVEHGDSTALFIRSDRRGGDSRVQVTGGTANAVLQFGAGEEYGDGNVDDISAVTLAEVKAVIEGGAGGILVDGIGGRVRISSLTTGAASSVQVLAASTADDELGLDNAVHAGGTGAAVDTLRVDAKYDGTYSSNVSVIVTSATSGVPSEFNLVVLQGGAVEKTFPNLTMQDSAPRFVEKIVNATDGSGSELINVQDLNAAAGNALAERPVNSAGSPPVPFGPLAGGNDGLVGLADIDFVGDAASRTGFRSFDLNDDIDLVISPDRATPGVHNAGLSYASVTRNQEVFFIVDPPAGLSPAGILNYVDSVAALVNTTEAGAVYWPRVKVLNPNASVFGAADTIIVPPSGHIAGMFARTDSSRVGGVYDPPGGVERGQLPGVVGFENDQVLAENVRDLLAPKLINPITKLRGQPIAVDDVLTLKSNGAFPTVAERRGVSFIEKAIKDGLQFARLRNNDEALRDEIERTVEAFLLLQTRVKAFRSQDPTKAFFVDVSEALNPPSEQFAGKVNVRVGLATQKPARFLILSFAQDTRAIDEELAAVSG